MLLGAVQHVQEAGGDVKLLWGRLFGQERNLTTSSIARINLFLHGIEDFQIVRGDTLRQPAFFDGDRLATFDCVIANPPFSLERWGEEIWANDPYGRNFAGLPPSSSGDYAWVQHMLRSMAPGRGRMAVVLPHGALFRMGAEGKIRRKILEMDLLEAVIGLGPNLFYGTGLAAAILVFRAPQAAGARGTGALRRWVGALPQGPQPEHAGAGARRADPCAVPGLSGCAGRGPRGDAGRDRAQRLESEHPAVRGAGRRRRDDHPGGGAGESEGQPGRCVCGGG